MFLFLYTLSIFVYINHRASTVEVDGHTYRYVGGAQIDNEHITLVYKRSN